MIMKKVLFKWCTILLIGLLLFFYMQCKITDYFKEPLISIPFIFVYILWGNIITNYMLKEIKHKGL
jgi:hypothetical protein